jgi:hypothetical protein
MLLFDGLAAWTEYVNDNIYVFVFLCMHMYSLLERVIAVGYVY